MQTLLNSSLHSDLQSFRETFSSFRTSLFCSDGRVWRRDPKSVTTDDISKEAFVPTFPESYSHPQGGIVFHFTLDL